MLVLADNPIAGMEGYRLDVLVKLVKLDKLDKEVVSPEEREEVQLVLEAKKAKAAA
jgi:hypothetical protein